MDALERDLYDMKFKLAFTEKIGIPFQEFFEQLAKQAYGDDFDIVEIGNEGDLKCDGRLNSTKTIFQCYATKTFNQSACMTKISEDFEGALMHWKSWGMRQWIFVHNHDATAKVHQLLDQLREENPSIVIKFWSEADVRKILFEDPDPNKLSAIFGPVLSYRDYSKIGIPEFQKVIDSLVTEGVEIANRDLSPPSMEKLDKNQLSETAKRQLEIGRMKSHEVRKYLKSSSNLDKGEEIADAFRHKYKKLKDEGFSTEKIFWELQKFVGYGGEPDEQGAQMAVLSYFFDRCDIFENPDAEGVLS